MISFEKFERLPNKFNTVEEYDLMLQVIEAEVLLGLKKLIIHEKLEELLEIPFLSGFDLFYLNPKGQIIIGDTLYTTMVNSITAQSLISGHTKTTTFDLENDEESQDSNFINKSISKNSDEISETEKYGPEVVFDYILNTKDSRWYSLKINSLNLAHNVLGSTRALSWTKIRIKKEGTSNWVVPDNALLSGFASMKSEVIQFTRYAKWFGPCRDRTNSKSGTHSAEVKTGRCWGASVQSMLTFTLGGATLYSYFIN